MPVEIACLFVRAAGERLVTAERLVLAFPALAGAPLRACDLAYRAASHVLVVVLRFGDEGAPAEVRARLEFWCARAGGRASALDAMPERDVAAFRASFDACELKHPGIARADLFDAAGAFFTAAGAPAGRRRTLADRPGIAMDVTGPGWEGVRYDPEDHALFVPAPLAPPVGDELPLAFRVPGVDRPLGTRGIVAKARTPAEAGAGEPAGYVLVLESPPAALHDALVAHAPLERSGSRVAPRYAVRAPVRIAASTIPALAGEVVENLSQGGAFVRTATPAAVGTEIALELRLPNGADLRAAAVVAFASETGMGVRFTLDAETEAVLAAAIAHLSARPRRALVVDDDALVRRMLADALAERGFEVLTAADGASGLHTLSEEVLALDLLVTDVRMPGLDGEAFVRTIRSAGGEADLAIVAVTGRMDPGLEPRLEAAGADAVLDKALGPELVAQAADAALERKRLAQGDG